ncbi:peptidoglycan DD-metalloendopeptidase family protein [Marilutibacter alkalisoli]|uniref:M23 family metallopeptidase n=1 Tax=Marilutibacter alkalisoli TaxID=2591633 RepID=A0A514BQK1_9GAMM|nr:M23 family metallopeptidase [Lysobacter alkalisoli]QDH69299.1 M23 family metallopeptidase [Lysobacter alkalisoli]
MHSPTPARPITTILAGLLAGGALVSGVLVGGLLVTGTADAGRLYRWTDANGVSHYGDRRPDTPASPVTEIPVHAEPDAMARLRVERDAGYYQAWADNALAGPIEVMLHFSNRDNIEGMPALPARATVPARGSALVSVLGPVQPGRGGSFELRMDSLPGDPNARPRDAEYLMPLQQAEPDIQQGYAGRFSHNDPQNRHAVDFAAPIGTPVLAAREGVVMQVESDFDRAGLSMEKYGGRANFIRILHDDGTMALYAHLREGGAHVRVGQRVRAGQVIGLSGNTGFTTGPHLHFVVQVNRGMRLESIPFRMRGPQGALRFDITR